jgi:hypothetical protein
MSSPIFKPQWAISAAAIGWILGDNVAHAHPPVVLVVAGQPQLAALVKSSFGARNQKIVSGVQSRPLSAAETGTP